MGCHNKNERTNMLTIFHPFMDLIDSASERIANANA